MRREVKYMLALGAIVLAGEGVIYGIYSLEKQRMKNHGVYNLSPDTPNVQSSQTDGQIGDYIND